ncbi:hypothetical protein [Phaeobacter sp. J2-8]|uniref:hypothetical protein n=1 Tax=Phaeobacter sp. J2-8 TaxID=2931394 RepID=UPI001FD0D634|nr:hypothetical protein [Phaeobacter sp. J2-8]MCJ7871680.1 hypothetical protein [Phaeobacter sp. J2-8]
MSVLWTSEDIPRRVTVKGRSAIDPECMVVEVEGKRTPITGVWMYPTGYLHPLGSNVFAADTPEAARQVRDGFQ